MPSPPPTLDGLLRADIPQERDDAWESFVDRHTRLILHVARSLAGDSDAVMDRYAHVLDQLRRDDFKRLRRYAADGRAEFTTWLVVVVRRLCLDFERHRYGRSRARGSLDQAEDRATRRRLVELISSEVDLQRLGDHQAAAADEALESDEAHRALSTALSNLEPEDRLLVKLRFEDDLPVPRIARELGLATRFHVYRRLDRVLGELRGHLARLEPEDSSR